MAFAVLKALVPLTLLGFALLGAVGQRRVWTETLVPGLHSHFQATTLHAIDAAVQRIFAHNSTGLIVLASLMTLWYISGSVRAVMGATNDVYDCDETRPWTVRYPLSIALAGAITVFAVGAMLAVLVLAARERHGRLGVVASVGRWLIAVALLAVAVGLLMRFSPVRHRSNFWITGGSALVIIVWLGA